MRRNGKGGAGAAVHLLADESGTSVENDGCEGNARL